MTTHTSSFSTRLRQLSWDDHEQAANNAYLDALINGGLTVEQYAMLVRQHLAVYEALEALNPIAAADPRFCHFVSPELDRVPSLRRDLVDLLGEDWETKTQVLETTTAYTNRIAAAAGDGPRFLSHHYVRYLGDLSGGQFLGREIERVFSIEGHRGTSFYVFVDIEPDEFKKAYRMHLDQVPMSQDEQETMIEEVLVAYQMNTAMHEALSAAVAAR